MQEKSLGEWIAEKRMERHMTQAALAVQFGVSDKAVSKWERNLSRPEGNHSLENFLFFSSVYSKGIISVLL